MGKALQLFPLVYPDDHDIVTQIVSHSQLFRLFVLTLVNHLAEFQFIILFSFLVMSILIKTHC